MVRFILLLVVGGILFGIYTLIDKAKQKSEEKHKRRIQELEMELLLEKEKNKQKGDNLKN